MRLRPPERHELDPIEVASRDEIATLQLQRIVAGVGTLSAAATRTGVREDRDFAAFPATPIDLPAFTIVDLAAELEFPGRLIPGARLQLRAENVANVAYQQVAGFASPGRTLYAGLKLLR